MKLYLAGWGDFAAAAAKSPCENQFPASVHKIKEKNAARPTPKRRNEVSRKISLPTFFFKESGGRKKGRLYDLPFGEAQISAYTFSHFWLATVQDVLQADWQEVWHSPQPPLAALAFRVAPLRV